MCISLGFYCHFLRPDYSHAVHHLLAIYAMGARSLLLKGAYETHVAYQRPAFPSPKPDEHARAEPRLVIDQSNWKEYLGDERCASFKLCPNRGFTFSQVLPSICEFLLCAASFTGPRGDSIRPRGLRVLQRCQPRPGKARRKPAHAKPLHGRLPPFAHPRRLRRGVQLARFDLRGYAFTLRIIVCPITIFFFRNCGGSSPSHRG